jgi:hypothetical protein
MNETFTIDQLCACARREVAFRKRVYPRLIQNGKLTAQKAEEEIALMNAITDLLESQQQPRLF